MSYQLSILIYPINDIQSEIKIYEVDENPIVYMGTKNCQNKCQYHLN